MPDGQTARGQVRDDEDRQPHGTRSLPPGPLGLVGRPTPHFIVDGHSDLTFERAFPTPPGCGLTWPRQRTAGLHRAVAFFLWVLHWSRKPASDVVRRERALARSVEFQ